MENKPTFPPQIAQLSKAVQIAWSRREEQFSYPASDPCDDDPQYDKENRETDNPRQAYARSSEKLRLSRIVPLRRVRLCHHHGNPKGPQLPAMHQKSI
jgi:hypothetical protein